MSWLSRLLAKPAARVDQPLVAAMPSVEELPDIEAFFADVREQAAGDKAQGPLPAGRRLVLVTPGRIIAFQPCPAPGSMPADQTAPLEKLISSRPPRKFAIIAAVDAGAVARGELARAIPFLGMLLGLAYLGHAVWVFEGHPSALAAGCRDADFLIVDSAMLACLAPDWQHLARSVMRGRALYVHDRTSFALRPAT